MQGEFIGDVLLGHARLDDTQIRRRVIPPIPINLGGYEDHEERIGGAQNGAQTISHGEQTIITPSQQQQQQRENGEKDKTTWIKQKFCGEEARLFGAWCCMLPCAIIMFALLAMLIHITLLSIAVNRRITTTADNGDINHAAVRDGDSVKHEENQKRRSFNFDGFDPERERLPRPAKNLHDNLDRFEHPRTYNREIANETGNACINFYNRCCGRWDKAYHRFFSNNQRFATRTLARVSDTISNKNYISTNVEQHNTNLNLMYASCESTLNTLRSMSSNDNSPPVSWRLFVDDVVREMDAGLVTVKDIPRIFGTLFSRGIKVPIDVDLREIPYFFPMPKHHEREHADSFSFAGRTIPHTHHLSRYESERRTTIMQFEQSGVLRRGGSNNARTIAMYKQKARMILGRNHSLDYLSDALSIESHLYRAFSDPSSYYADDSHYTRFSYSQFRTVFINSGFDMDIFLSHSGIPAAHLLPHTSGERPVYLLSIDFFVHLDWILTSFTIAQWKNYLKYMIYGTFLRRFHVGDLFQKHVYHYSPLRNNNNNNATNRDMQDQTNATNEDTIRRELTNSFIKRTCTQFASKHYAISTCKAFTSHIPEYARLREQSESMLRQVHLQIANLVKNSPEIFCLKKNGTRHTRLTKHIEAMEISVGECFFSDHERRVTSVLDEHRETLWSTEKRLRPDVHKSHAENAMNMFADPYFRLYRHSFLDSDGVDHDRGVGTEYEISRSTDDPLYEFADVNGYYDNVHHRIVISPGMLAPPFASDLYDELSRYSMMGMVVGHEIVHATEKRLHDAIENMSEEERRADPEAQCLMQQKKCLVRHYSPAPLPYSRRGGSSNEERESEYGARTFSENRADILGLDAAISVVRKNESILKSSNNITRDMMDFFSSAGQVWCSGYKSILQLAAQYGEDVHGMFFDRVARVYSQLSPEHVAVFERVFGCEFPKAIEKSCLFSFRPR